MKRRNLVSAALFTMIVAACGPAEAVVTVEIEMMDPETGEQVVRPLEGLEVRMLPFDRDAIFDSLTTAAARPEPEYPEELRAVRDSIQEAQAEWREAESEWLARRERLDQLSREMNQYSPAETRYRELFFDFQEQEDAYLAAERRKDQAFERFDRLQQSAFAELEEVRAQITAWEDEAFADYGTVVDARLRETRRDIMADTTDATGRATLRGGPGEWWVNARYRLPTEELYWNIRVTLERGEPFELRLTRANAEQRDTF